MKSFDDFGFSDELKKRVLLVDLPGSDTTQNPFNDKDKNNRSAYEKLLSISSSFIYINKGRAINETNNQTILKKLYTNIQNSSKMEINDYLKECLFVINLFRSLPIEELNMDHVKKDLSTILFDCPEHYKEINSVFFNAKNFYDYLSLSTLLQDYEATLNKFEESYKSADDSSFLNTGNFPKYCLKQLKQKLKDLGIKYGESQNCSPEFLKEIENIISVKMAKLHEPQLTKEDKENINKLAKIFNWLQDEKVYLDMDAYKNSYCQEFLEILRKQIEFSKVYKDEEYIKKLKDSLKYFDMLFEKNIKINELESKTIILLKEKRNEFMKKFKENFKIVSIQPLFEEAREDIEAQIKIYKDQAKIMINKGKSQEEIISTISKALEEIIKTLYKDLNENIEKFIKQNQILINEIISIFDQLELKKIEPFKINFLHILNTVKISIIGIERENIKLSNFQETMKLYWSNTKSFFKGREQSVIDKIDDLKDETIQNLNNKEKKIDLKLKEEKIKLKTNLNSILAINFNELKNIKEKEWIECKEQYIKAKKCLLTEN